MKRLALLLFLLLPLGLTTVIPNEEILDESSLASLYPNYYAGMSFYTREDFNDFYQYRMNWGWDGCHNNDYYSAHTTYAWEGYNIDNRVYFNLIPMELYTN